MKQVEINSLNMFKAVIALLETYPATWSTVSPMVTVVSDLKAVVSTVEQQSQQQLNHNPTGYTTQKDDLLAILLERTYKLAAKMKAFAKVTKNNILLALVDYEPSSLQDGSEMEVIKRCEIILKKATENLANLAPYNVTQAELDVATQSLAAVVPLFSQRDAVRSERKTATSSIPELLREGRDHLDILDDLVDGLIEDDTFATSYRNTRNVVDRSTSGATAAKV